VAPTSSIHHDWFTKEFDWVFWGDSGVDGYSEEDVKYYGKCRVVPVPSLSLDLTKRLD
jgi:hypothetical protein